MNKTAKILITVLSVLAILFPFVFMIGVALCTPSQHSDVYHGRLNEKFDRLYSIEGPKLVFVGGSSVAFGLDSELLETYTGMPTVNFGLYADLGTKLMLDLSEDAIGEGDVIVISPELDPQTLSLFFNGLSTWRAIDDDPSMLFHIKSANLSSMWGSLWGFTKTKLDALTNGTSSPSGVYNANNFNAWGDISYKGEGGEELRTENVIGGSFYHTHTPIDPSIEVWDSAFIDYLNQYVKKADAKGASVYFAYCPMNRYAITDGEGNFIVTGDLPGDKIAAYEAALADALDCEILGSFSDYVYEPNFFYDSNFHLNVAGVARHARNLLSDLWQELHPTEALPTVDEAKFPIPEMPELDIVAGIDPNRVYTDGDFLFKLSLSGEATIVGVSEAGLSKQLLAVPSTVVGDGVTYAVAAVGDGAFGACRVTETVVLGPEFITSIGNRLFAGSSVKAFYMYCPVKGGAQGEVSLSQSAFLEDAPAELKVYISAELYVDYAVDYFWESLLANLSDVFAKTNLAYAELVGGLDVSDFVFADNGDGTLTIIGVTDRAKDDVTLAIPAEHNGKRIKAIAANAFVGASAQTIVLHPDTTSLTVRAGALAGSDINLVVIYSAYGTVTCESGISSGIVFYAVGGGYYDAYASAWTDAFIMDYTDTPYESLFE